MKNRNTKTWIVLSLLTPTPPFACAGTEGHSMDVLMEDMQMKPDALRGRETDADAQTEIINLHRRI